MDAFELREVETVRREAGKLYQEFLRVPDLSAGLYVLDAGATDPQQPHREDELYYVVSGSATITVGDEERAVAPGSLYRIASPGGLRVTVSALNPSDVDRLADDIAVAVLDQPSTSGLSR